MFFGNLQSQFAKCAGSPPEIITLGKYNSSGGVLADIFVRHGLSENISSQLAARTNMALANNTKSNYNTVKNNIKICELALDCDLKFPWTITQTLHFIAYLLFTRNVK